MSAPSTVLTGANLADSAAPGPGPHSGPAAGWSQGNCRWPGCPEPGASVKPPGRWPFPSHLPRRGCQCGCRGVASHLPGPTGEGVGFGSCALAVIPPGGGGTTVVRTEHTVTGSRGGGAAEARSPPPRSVPERSRASRAAGTEPDAEGVGGVESRLGLPTTLEPGLLSGVAAFEGPGPCPRWPGPPPAPPPRGLSGTPPTRVLPVTLLCPQDRTWAATLHTFSPLPPTAPRSHAMCR